MKTKLYDYLSEIFPPMVAEDIAAQAKGDYYNLGRVIVKPKYKKKLNAVLHINACAQCDIKESIRSSDSAARVFQFLAHELTEHFYIATLDRSGHIINLHDIGHGGISQTIVDVQVILRHAIMDLAKGIIVCHNHPSGNTVPSIQDKNITKAISEACKMIDIRLLDHIIIAKDKYYSFSDEGTLDL